MNNVAATLILATTSKSRITMLSNAGVDFEAMPSRTDEEALKRALQEAKTSPRDISDALAELKATKISNKHGGAIVIGSDQVLECEGRMFSKAVDLAQARETLKRLRGKTHHLHSAVVIAENGNPVWRHVATAKMTMHDFSDDFIDRYLADAGDAILSSVGGYFFEDTGSRLFLRAAGDYFTILGMPLLEVLGYLRLRGIIPK